MNLTDEVEVANFFSWIQDYQEDDVVAECQGVIDELVDSGVTKVKHRGEIVSMAIQRARGDELERGERLSKTCLVSELLPED